MAIVYPGKYCFFVHARTGSSALHTGLEKAHHFAIKKTRYHHATVDEQLKLCRGGEARFAVIRNPFDVVASWFMLNRFKTITDLLDKYKHTWFRNTDGKLFTFFEPHVDYHIRYERLEIEINALMDGLRLKRPKLGRENVTPNKKHYSTYYTPVEVERMYDEFPEIEQYGYSYATADGIPKETRTGANHSG
jgi:hypothetical protein